MAHNTPDENEKLVLESDDGEQSDTSYVCTVRVGLHAREKMTVHCKD